MHSRRAQRRRPAKCRSVRFPQGGAVPHNPDRCRPAADGVRPERHHPETDGRTAAPAERPAACGFPHRGGTCREFLLRAPFTRAPHGNIRTSRVRNLPERGSPVPNRIFTGIGEAATISSSPPPSATDADRERSRQKARQNAVATDRRGPRQVIGAPARSAGRRTLRSPPRNRGAPRGGAGPPSKPYRLFRTAARSATEGPRPPSSRFSRIRAIR